MTESEEPITEQDPKYTTPPPPPPMTSPSGAPRKPRGPFTKFGPLRSDMDEPPLATHWDGPPAMMNRPPPPSVMDEPPHLPTKDGPPAIMTGPAPKRGEPLNTAPAFHHAATPSDQPINEPAPASTIPTPPWLLTGDIEYTLENAIAFFEVSFYNARTHPHLIDIEHHVADSLAYFGASDQVKRWIRLNAAALVCALDLRAWMEMREALAKSFAVVIEACSWIGEFGALKEEVEGRRSVWVDLIEEDIVQGQLEELDSCVSRSVALHHEFWRA